MTADLSVGEVCKLRNRISKSSICKLQIYDTKLTLTLTLTKIVTAVAVQGLSGQERTGQNIQKSYKRRYISPTFEAASIEPIFS